MSDAENGVAASASKSSAPIDPTINLQPGNSIPAQFILNAGPNIDPIIMQLAQYADLQTRKLATTLLTTGMLKGKDAAEIEQVVNQLSSRDVYHSHGSVIDHAEATRLGLNVTSLQSDDALWRWFWLLRCMYEHDGRAKGVIKMFEGF